jgi:hypothetical protein
MTANPTRFQSSKTLAIRGASIDDDAHDDAKNSYMALTRHR